MHKMDSTRYGHPKFLKVLSKKDTGLNKMTMPYKFLVKYGEKLPPEFKLRLRTCYGLPVDFDKSTGEMVGMSTFFRHFGLKGGEILVFEYSGRYDLCVYILGTDCSEIEYPRFLHHLQSGQALLVTKWSEGWKFVQFITPLEEIEDSIDAPVTFVKHCKGNIPGCPEFVLSNGSKFVGSFCAHSNNIGGLNSTCNLLGFEDLNSFHMLLFTYEGGCLFHLSPFDENLVEIMFPVSLVIQSGETSTLGNSETGFEMIVKEFHKYPYCYGLDIPAKFRPLCHHWSFTDSIMVDSIMVYSGMRSWKLEIKHRKDWKRTTINDGWIKFRNDLKLDVGDLCGFKSKNSSFQKFNVSVIKKSK